MYTANDLKKYVTLPLQFNWHLAQSRKAWVAAVTLPLVISECFWKTWYEVYRER